MRPFDYTEYLVPIYTLNTVHKLTSLLSLPVSHIININYIMQLLSVSQSM